MVPVLRRLSLSRVKPQTFAVGIEFRTPPAPTPEIKKSAAEIADAQGSGERAALRKALPFFNLALGPGLLPPLFERHPGWPWP